MVQIEQHILVANTIWRITFGGDNLRSKSERAVRIKFRDSNQLTQSRDMHGASTAQGNNVIDICCRSGSVSLSSH